MPAVRPLQLWLLPCPLLRPSSLLTPQLAAAQATDCKRNDVPITLHAPLCHSPRKCPWQEKRTPLLLKEDLQLCLQTVKSHRPARQCKLHASTGVDVSRPGQNCRESVQGQRTPGATSDQYPRANNLLTATDQLAPPPADTILAHALAARPWPPPPCFSSHWPPPAAAAAASSAGGIWTMSRPSPPLGEAGRALKPVGVAVR